MLQISLSESTDTYSTYSWSLLQFNSISSSEKGVQNTMPLQGCWKCGQTLSSVFDTSSKSKTKTKIPKHRHAYDFFSSKLSENELNVDEMNL